MHIIATSSTNLPVEVQVRTRAQDVWANVSEQVATRIDLDVKYGGGPSFVQDALSSTSELWRLWDLRAQESLELSRRANELLRESERLVASETTQGRREGRRIRAEALAALQVAQATMDETDPISIEAQRTIRELWARMAAEGLLE